MRRLIGSMLPIRDLWGSWESLSDYILGGTGFFLTWKARNNRRSTTPRMANRTTAETTVVVPRTPLPPATETVTVSVGIEEASTDQVPTSEPLYDTWAV